MIPGTVSVAAESCSDITIINLFWSGIGADTTYGAQGNPKV
jgi:hypothetical protein